MNTDNIYKTGDFKFEVPKSVHLVHKNGGHRIVPLRFCWLGFLLPPIWAMCEGLWRPFALSLLPFLMAKIAEATILFCAQSGVCSAMPFTSWLQLASCIGYLFTIGYFGFNGKNLLIADLLKHGYHVEGSPRPVETIEDEE